MQETIFAMNPTEIAAIRLSVKVLNILAPILIVFLGWQVLKMMGAGMEQLKGLLHKKRIWVALVGWVGCMGLLNLFFVAQPLIPEGYQISEISIQSWQGAGGEYLKISDAAKIDEFSAKLNQFQCRKSISSTVPNSDRMIEIDIMSQDQAENIHLVLTNERQTLHTNLSEQFIYDIDDKKYELYQWVSNYMAERL